MKFIIGLLLLIASSVSYSQEANLICTDVISNIEVYIKSIRNSGGALGMGYFDDNMIHIDTYQEVIDRIKTENLSCDDLSKIIFENFNELFDRLGKFLDKDILGSNRDTLERLNGFKVKLEDFRTSSNWEQDLEGVDIDVKWWFDSTPEETLLGRLAVLRQYGFLAELYNILNKLE